MSRREGLRRALAGVAHALGDDRPRVVFVGGTVAALYPLDGADVRPTVDVDCVVDVATAVQYYAFVARLRARGFHECSDDGAPLCRLVHGETRVDVMPAVDTAIGPTNRWYPAAIRAAVSFEVARDTQILAITPEYFVATKLEAFRGRGGGDYQASHDLEDALAVLAGLPGLREAIGRGESTVTHDVRGELASLTGREAFIDAIHGHFDGDDGGQARADRVLAWLRRLAA